MNPRLKIYQTLPDLIKGVLLVSEGWLVGGSIKSLLEDKKPADYDILVPSRELFQVTAATLGPSFSVDLNTFGGLKFIDDRFEIDIWPEELSHFIRTANKFEYGYNLKRNVLIQSI